MASSEKPQGEVLQDQEVTDILEELVDDEPVVVEELDPLEAAQAQAAEYLALAQRTRADLENYRRRTAKEREELLRYGAERVLTDMLGVLDDVERAQAHAAEENPLAEGVRMMHANLIAVLQRHNVTEVAGVGSVFDPNIHNAIQTVQTDAVEKGQIAEVYQKGYLLHDRLLRPAMVAVAG